MVTLSLANDTLLKRYGRNYGIDLLRIVAVYMIVVLHVLYFGGVLSSVSPLSLRYSVAWFLEMAAYGSVNVFAVISGYVNYNRKIKYSNLLLLCIQILFYTVMTTAVFGAFYRSRVTAQTLIYAVIPFKISGYWYFAAYFCLFFFMPYLNKLTECIDRKSSAKILIACFGVFSVLPTVLYQDIGGLANGYSVTWLAVMYFAGACVKKFDYKLNPKKAFLYYMLCVVASLAGKLGMETVSRMVLGQAKYGNLFSSYISPLIVLSSVFLFLCCKELKLNDRAVGIVRFFAPTTFGVYLIHMEPLIKDFFIVDRFSGFASLPALPMALCVLSTALGIWLVCSLIDRVRLMLFARLKIPSLCVRMEEKIRGFITNHLLRPVAGTSQD